MTTKLSKDEVGYRTGSSSKNCGNCSMFRPDGKYHKQGRCTLVYGHIRAGDYCIKWEVAREHA